jgi:arylsulfatase
MSAGFVKGLSAFAFGAAMAVGAAATGRAGDAAPKLELSQAPAGAPNIVLVLLDDVGFAASSTFGGPVPTPALDRLAKGGLRYNRFHTTGICSPTRASLLTGRNPHAVGVGSVLNSASIYPGYRGVLAPSAATVAEVLRQNGYATALFGKWHLVPDWEASPAGPFDRWPTQQGFDEFYGFLGGETDQFEPTLHHGTTPVRRPEGDSYHLTEDLASRAIEWIRLQRSLRPERPFFAYLAPGATHAPLQVPDEWIRRFRGRFDGGWDALREASFARQKQQGVIPKDARLTPRPAGLPAWDSLSPDQQRIAVRLMETYAGFLAHTDAQLARVFEALDEDGALEDTLFVVIVGDNGASAEGGLFGSWSYMGRIQGIETDAVAALLPRLDAIGGPASYAHYPAGWAWALDAPFQWTKQVASHLGGTRNGMVVSWPRRIRDAGGLRSQFAHVNDVAPTLLEAAGIEPPAVVNGVTQQPLDGASLVYSFDDAKAPGRHRTQYFEVYGNRAIYHDGWMASAYHGRPPWQVLAAPSDDFSGDTWELYRLDEDFSQARDLAAEEPARLRALQDLFSAEAARNGVLPLHSPAAHAAGLPRIGAGRDEFSYHAGAVGIPEKAAPAIFNRSHAIEARLEIPASGARGVVVAEGGRSAGYALYVDAQGRPAYVYDAFDVERLLLVGPEPLPAGAVTLRFEFAYDGGGPGRGGRGRLFANGKRVAEGRIGRTAPVFFTIDESFDVGTDTGSAVGDYPPYDGFTGAIREVRVELE